MKIILLTGPKASENTATINEVYKQLTQVMINPPPQQKLSYSHNDFECLVPHEKGYVALFSLGSTLERMYEAIINYSIAHCLIMTHTDQNGSEWTGFLNCIRECPQHTVITKTANNNADCQSIIDSI